MMAIQPNFQLPSVGFGSYLQNVVPEDVAVSAGAFSYSMQQVKNIKNIAFERFAQVVSSIEVTDANLDLVNGTNVPVDTTLADQGSNMLSLGSGPNGNYTASDFFGCMSGLPYSWVELQNNLLQAQTDKLANIYNQLFLATTWEAATIDVQYTEDPGPLYTVTGVTINSAGGGYGRGTAVGPLITINGGSGATATCTIGTDSTNAGSNGSGTFGRVISVTLTGAGIQTNVIPTATIECPPTDDLPVDTNGNISTSGTNTPDGTIGWPGMNTVVANYITQANDEILAIKNTKSDLVKLLNTIYNAAGNQLMIEQRARFTGLSPVATPRDNFVNQYPATMTVFTDNLGSYAQSTYPHMYSQTLEAISDLNTTGGQSIVALMRQERNKARLQQMGVSLDNEIPVINEDMCPVLISNGTVPIAKTGIEVQGINGNVGNPTTTYTVPSVLLQEHNGNMLIAPNPNGFFDPNTNDYIRVKKTTNIDEQEPIKNILNVTASVPNNTNLLGPNKNGTGPAIPKTVNATNLASIQSGMADTMGNSDAQMQPIIVVQTGAKIPTGEGTILDIGKPNFPGSLAGSTETNAIPCTLNHAYTSSVLLPSTLNTDEAVAKVVSCNCDCWVG